MIRFAGGILAGFVLFGQAEAQAPDRTFGVFVAERDIGTDARLLLANAALGGATAGVMQWARGRPIWPAVRGGAAGGMLAYAGKRVAVERWPGAGFVGREIGAVGHSVIRNASEGQSLLSSLILPIGPIRLYIRPDSQAPLRARIDAPTVVFALLLSASGDDFDAPASLSSGALIFRVPDIPLTDVSGTCVPGMAFGGAIVLNDMSAQATDSRNPVYAHERVHVLQYDQLLTTVSDPFEQWLGRRVRWIGSVKRFADLNVAALLALGPIAAWGDRTPWEVEAAWTTRQTFGDAPTPDEGVMYWGCRS